MIPADGIPALLARGEISSVELTRAYLERIATVDVALGATFAVLGESALREAATADAARARGELLGPLHGVPVGVKDNIDVAGVPTTVGSAFFREPAAADAECVRRVRAAGGVIVAKLALHEMAYGVTCRNAHVHDCNNAWDLARIPGGSSAGSGAAVAADLCTVALGTDTGGSVRIPAALNGVAALRPSPGLVPTAGVFPVSWTYDVVGPLARSAGDLGMVRLDSGPASGAWWTALAGADAPKIIARLPFVERPDHPAGMPAFVVSKPLAEAAATEVAIRTIALDRWRDGVPMALAGLGAEILGNAAGGMGLSLLVAAPGALDETALREALRGAGAADIRIAHVGSHAARFEAPARAP